jgi:hypothetical protein
MAEARITCISSARVVVLRSLLALATLGCDGATIGHGVSLSVATMERRVYHVAHDALRGLLTRLEQRMQGNQDPRDPVSALSCDERPCAAGEAVGPPRRTSQWIVHRGEGLLLAPLNDEEPSVSRAGPDSTPRTR